MGLQHSWTGGEAGGRLQEPFHVYGQSWPGSNGTLMSAIICPTYHTRVATIQTETHLDEELSIFSVELLHGDGGRVQLDRKI